MLLILLDDAILRTTAFPWLGQLREPALQSTAPLLHHPLLHNPPIGLFQAIADRFFVHIQAKIIHTVLWESSSIRFLSQHQAGLSIVPQVTPVQVSFLPRA